MAGGGERSSAVVNAVVPSKPNVSLVEETIQHSVSIITASEAIATIEFDVSSIYSFSLLFLKQGGTPPPPT